MRKFLVMTDAEKKVRFKRLIQRRQEATENVQEMPALDPIIFTIDEDQEHFSANPIRVKMADENMSLRLSCLGFPMNEVFSGKFQTLKKKILLNSELYMTSISQAAISNSLVSDTLGSLTFIEGIPDIPDIDKKILDNIIRIRNCASTENEPSKFGLLEKCVGR